MLEKSKKRYSRQRECILNYLADTTEHPTASMIYDMVREEIPNISLGTVYRNLSALVTDSEIISFDAGDGVERYDFRVSPHSHLICKSCGSVSDIFMDCEDELDLKAGEASGGKIDSHILVFNGLCQKCNE